MDQSRSLPRLCFLLTATLSAVGVALRFICMLCCFEADVGYFTPGALPIMSNALYAVAAFIAILCAARIPKNSLPTELHVPYRAPVAILLGTFLLIFATASLLDRAPSREKDIIFAAALLAISAAAYFFISAARTDSRYPDWLSLLGFLPVAWSIAGVGDTYFDRYVTMNSPVKAAVQFGLLGFMLILLAELRFRVGSVLPRYSLAFWSVGSYACLVGSIPLLYCYARDYLGGTLRLIAPGQYALYAAVLLCAGIYGLYTLFRYTRTVSTAPASKDHTPGSAEDAISDSPNTAE